MRFVALLSAILVLFTLAAKAEEPKGQFHRVIAIRMLGYEPDRMLPQEVCEKTANTARLVRVALIKEQPPEQKITLYLTIAAMIGEARSVCSDLKVAPEWLQPFVAEGETLPESVCKAAGEVIVGRINDTIKERVVNDHPDAIAGYIYGVVRALPPIVEACNDHIEAWARLKSQLDLLTMREKSQRDQRSCTLWRRAYYDELRKASTIAQEKGRAPGIEYLKTKAMIALVGSRNYCTDDLGRAFEMSNYDLTQTMINASPETPEPKKN